MSHFFVQKKDKTASKQMKKSITTNNADFFQKKRSSNCKYYHFRQAASSVEYFFRWYLWRLKPQQIIPISKNIPFSPLRPARKYDLFHLIIPYAPSACWRNKTSPALRVRRGAFCLEERPLVSGPFQPVIRNSCFSADRFLWHRRRYPQNE